MPTERPTQDTAPPRSPAERIMGEIAATKGQATEAAKTSAEILAILTNGEATDPMLMIEALIQGIAEQGEVLRRIETRLARIEAHLDARS